MEHDTITISQATALAAPEPPVVMQPAELELLGNQIAELSARIDAATYELLCHLHEFDLRHGWEGWRSCAHWLNWRTGLDLGAAREKLRVAAALADLNHVAAAMARGQLSYSKVRALTRVASPATEARLLAVALCATAAQVERLVRAWRRVDRDAQPDAEQVLLASRALTMQVDEDGMVVLRGRLPPEVGALLLRAVEAAMEQVPASADGGEPTIAQRRADALGLVAESALAGGLDPGNPADRFQVTVHVQADALPALPARDPAAAAPHVSAETRELSPAWSEPVAPAAPRVAAETRVVSLTPAEPGAHTANLGAEQATIAAPHISAATFEVSEAAFERVAPETDLDAGLAVIEQAGGLHLGKEAARRVACDAGIVVLHHGAGGEVLDVGRRTRTVPSAMRRALLSRDRGQCQFPGCESRHCDAHHVEHWADGGETRLQNLVLACRYHHRALHEGGFRVVPADTAGQFRFLRPDGTPLPAEPPMPSWAGAPLAPTDARLAAAGIGIGPHTATPEWYGESLDLTAALDVLWEPPAASWNVLDALGATNPIVGSSTVGQPVPPASRPTSAAGTGQNGPLPSGLFGA